MVCVHSGVEEGCGRFGVFGITNPLHSHHCFLYPAWPRSSKPSKAEFHESGAQHSRKFSNNICYCIVSGIIINLPHSQQRALHSSTDPYKEDCYLSTSCSLSLMQHASPCLMNAAHTHTIQASESMHVWKKIEIVSSAFHWGRGSLAQLSRSRFKRDKGKYFMQRILPLWYLLSRDSFKAKLTVTLIILACIFCFM